MLATGKLDAHSLITHHFPLDEINDPFETTEDKVNNRSILVALTL